MTDRTTTGHIGQVAMSFIVPVRNDADRLAVCLKSIRPHQTPRVPIEIIVADNGSQDNSAGVARAVGATVLSLPTGRVSMLRNRAATAAAGELLAFADADHELIPGWIETAVEHFRDPSIAAVGAPYTAPANGSWVQRVYDAFRDHRPGIRQTSWLGSGNLVVRRACFEEVAGFDESLETCEDVDLCQRFRARGYKVISDARLVSTHFGDPATLKQLLFSELWRGRDNLRVSLRHRPSLADVPSVLIPILDVGLMATALVSIAVLGWEGLWLTTGASASLLGLAGLRAVRMLARLSDWRPVTLARAMSVAFVYDVARALALIIGVPHRRA